MLTGLGDEKETKRTFLRNKVKSQLNVQVCIITKDEQKAIVLQIDQPISEGLPSPDILSFRRGSQQKKPC